MSRLRQDGYAWVWAEMDYTTYTVTWHWEGDTTWPILVSHDVEGHMPDAPWKLVKVGEHEALDCAIYKRQEPA